ncbi:RNA 2',3'-cyclic phosphodiesterase [Pseudoduganella violacea]|uniref:RNA 2',3'-cyclic phosphodiesterase n=1 Tax=Pseudoduganella violacea TaxID=1715466 RepID=A0A7W5BB69_9BURK|nr:RNA 2',3'-cyclic phosphodiesterase [Pseudoduganella violacea]MBB3119696.1 2'-5' RNA ligase [Pseudoduganella violacea]
MITNQSSGGINAAPAHKLFFALWPDAATRGALAALQSQVAGRATPPDKLHLTLAFLGQQPATALPALLDILHALSVPPLRLEIDCFGYFSKPRIAWAGMSAVPPTLMALQEDLMRRLAAAGFSPATHGEFRPHLTLAREAKTAPPAAAAFVPIAWEVKQIALVESLPSGLYLPVASR